ncbi:MAG: glycyl-tRNA synthetase [Conexibacter sp.]|nr:glycyl-tRNA synthetase [Conexibacter sp.]
MATDVVTMDRIVSLSKRRGFVFPSSEIYGGVGSTYDYGHYGVLLKTNVKGEWWRSMLQERDDIVAIDSAIIQSPRVWEASGHLAGFSDPLVDCRTCGRRFRADHLDQAQCGRRPSLHPGEFAECDLTEARDFNLMFETTVGPVRESGSTVYLRPETAQGIFINFKNVLQFSRKKPPFGIAQIGKSFRNEITPGNFTFRVREFEQAELEFFVPQDGNDLEWFQQWVTARKKWYSDYGVRADRLRFYELTPEERPFYAKAGIDVEYLFPWGWGELESIAHRGTYDLDRHIEYSGKDLQFFDEASKAKYTPILIESSAGMDRTTLTMLIDAFDRETIVEGEKQTERTVLRFHPKIAPVQVGVFPLARNKPELVERAQGIERGLRPAFRTQYDEGNVGQLYRRQDEIGTPFCIMIDYQTLDDATVTVRDRDSMKQDRVGADALAGYLSERLG